MIMDLCDGTLDSILLAASGTLPDRTILKIFGDVCSGVLHMHSQQPPIAHRSVPCVHGWRAGWAVHSVPAGNMSTCFCNLRVWHQRRLQGPEGRECHGAQQRQLAAVRLWVRHQRHTPPAHRRCDRLGRGASRVGPVPTLTCMATCIFQLTTDRWPLSSSVWPLRCTDVVRVRRAPGRHQAPHHTHPPRPPAVGPPPAPAP